ncbi:hypothetical protein PRNP1_013047 [Phytophthora ramorum]
MGCWQRWVDPRVTADDRWHSSRVELVRSPVLLGDHLVAELRGLARASADDMAVARCGQFLNKKLRSFECETRLLIRLADSARVLSLLLRTVDSVLGMTDQLETEVRAKWLQNLQQERAEWVQEIVKVLQNDEKLKFEMGNERQRVEVLALLRHEMDRYSRILTHRELGVVSQVFDAVARRGHVVVGTLPSWFATSEVEWFRAKTTAVEGGEEACERQAALWAKLHHPNVRKFFGACHVGQAFVIHEACTELPLAKDNVPRRRRKAKGERVSAKKLSKTEYRALEKAALTWKHVLGCALGLQYVHERGLVHKRLSAVHLLYSQASQKGILSGMGLVRHQKTIKEDTDERPSISADTLAFGLAILEIIVKDRTDDVASSRWLQSDRLPDVRPDFVAKAEWDLVVSMCDSDPAARICMADVVHQISILANHNARPVAKTPSSSPDSVEDVKAYEIQTLGMTLKDTLDEIEQLCGEADSVGDVNHPVYDRLLDVYNQLLASPAPTSTAFVESFSLVVLRFFDMLDQRSFGPPSLATDMCASRTVAGKNYSFHHDIDMLLRTSNLPSTNRVHHWQAKWKANRERRGEALKSCVENPVSLLSQLSNDVDRSEAIALLQFEARTQLDIDESEDLPLWFIPPYQVQLGRHIADGSFGAVYEGEWLDTDVVIKQVLLEQTEREHWEQFRREADLWFALNHPNLVKLYENCFIISRKTTGGKARVCIQMKTRNSGS